MSPSSIFSSNGQKLSLREWIILLLICFAVLFIITGLWSFFEKFGPDTNYRISYSSSNDYWMIERWLNLAVKRDKIAVLGDSVIWGQYVSNTGTLVAFLNQNSASNDFANLGIDGLHPVAMYGFLKYYAGKLKNRNVILNLNLLWLASAKQDLSTNEEIRFNHPQLVPQFFPKIACYHASTEEKLGIIGERIIPFFSWTDHIKIVYFNNTNLSGWMMQNPQKNPIKAVNNETFKLNEQKQNHASERSWIENEIPIQNLDWVSFDDSFQWRYFKDCINLLKKRNNRVFVLIGPFNEHLLTDDSRLRYEVLRKKTEIWLKESNIMFFSVPTLPSGYYADGSHPLKEGYNIISKQILQNGSFCEWLKY